MKSLHTVTLFILLFSTLIVSGNNDQPTRKLTDANITGHIESAATKEHLPYTSIVVKGTTIGCMADGTGHFFLKNLPVGEIELEASAIGYEKSVIKVTLQANKTIEVNFLLEQKAMLMNEVVVSATRNETNKKEAPIIVNVTSAKQFEATASSSLAESMNFQSGLRVENSCGNCGTTQLRINGLDGQYSQILLDSRPIFSSLAGMYGLEQLPVGMIERVEVIRGGGSALFGSCAIGGVVNIITKEPLRNSVNITNTTSILQGGKTDINTALNGSFVSDDHKAGVYVFGTVKDRNWYDRNGDGFSDIPMINAESVGFRGYYRTSNYSRITAEYHHINELRRGGNKFSSPPHEADIAEQLNHKIDGGGLRYDWNTPNLKHRLSLFTSMQNIKRDSYFGVEQNLNAYGNTDDRTYNAGAQYTYIMEKLLFMPAELTSGFEYNYNNLQDRFLGINRVLLQKTHIAGGFLQNEWKTEQLSLLAGARIDKHNLMNKVVFSPRANVRYSPSEKIGLRASYSSGYRPPQAYNEDLHIEAVGGMLSVIELDKDLKPEYSHSISASTDLYHNFGILQTNLLIEGFYTLLDDVFTLEETGISNEFIYYIRRNGSGATIQGVNLEAKLGIPDVIEVQMGYTFQQSRYKEPEKWSDQLEAQRKMFRAPDHYGYITANATITKKFKASVFGNYTGSMLVKHTLSDGINETKLEKITPNFWDMGMKLSYTFRLSNSIHLEFSGGVKNIFDSFQKDLDFGALKDAPYFYGPSMPRTYFFEVKFLM